MIKYFKGLSLKAIKRDISDFERTILGLINKEFVQYKDIGITKGVIENGKKIPKKTARNWICKHLDETVPNKDFFSEKVFTQEVLEKIEARIEHVFNYNTEEREIDLEEILEEDAN